MTKHQFMPRTTCLDRSLGIISHVAPELDPVTQMIMVQARPIESKGLQSGVGVRVVRRL